MSCYWKGLLLVAFIAFLFGILLNIPDESIDHVDVDTLPDAIKKWYKMGKFISVFNKFKIFTLTVESSSGKEPMPTNFPTLCFIHGFPSSSFDYHKAMPRLSKQHRVVTFDHLGFGFSDKPVANFSYSIQELADVTLTVWRTLGIKKCHVVAHDMGDSVLAEILTRRQRELLPTYFDNFFQSITFTNGGMIIGLANLRIGQRLLKAPYLGHFFNYISSQWKLRFVSNQQLKSIWSPSAEEKSRDADIADLQEINAVTGAERILYKTIRYLDDRFMFENRWLEALRSLDLPCHLCWGDSDAVSPVRIPETLRREFLPQCKLSFMTDTGHFLMLEQPQRYSSIILNFIKNSRS